MRPAPRLIYLLWILLLLGLAASLTSGFAALWAVVGVVIGAVVLIDALWLMGKSRITLKRNLPTRLSLGELEEVEITLHNQYARRVRVSLFEGLPPTMVSNEMPWRGTIPARGYAQLFYKLRPLERGLQVLEPAHLLLTSLFGFWQRLWRIGEKLEIKVYPNFEPVIRFNLLAMTDQVDQMGIISKNAVGVSKEFHQLRDYQEGDAITQIDWKATSRRASLISREYRQQRDQTIIFAVDCGRRMRAMDGALTQFDHSLNAILLLAQMALRQGDSVGVMGFGGTNRWLPPVKGGHMMPTLLNHLYDYQTSTEPSDFAEAVERLMVRQKRRAMIVFLTNLRSEDATHLVAPLHQLRKKHLVLMASLKEKTITDLLSKPVRDFDQALTCAATHLYLEDRSAMLASLKNQRIQIVDATAQDLPIELVNRYLEIKKEGQL